MFTLLCIILLSCGNNAQYAQGQELYTNRCASCHGIDGAGLGTLTPPIKASDYYLKYYKEVPSIILSGAKDTMLVNGQLYWDEMPGNHDFSATEIANIMNYINSKWYPDKSFLSPIDIKKSLGTYTPKDTTAVQKD